MEVFMPNPRVVGVWIALPVHEVLQLTSSPLAPGVEDCFDLIFFLVIDDRRGACEGRAVCLRLLIWKEEVSMEHVVDLH